MCKIFNLTLASHCVSLGQKNNVLDTRYFPKYFFSHASLILLTCAPMAGAAVLCWPCWPLSYSVTVVTPTLEVMVVKVFLFPKEMGMVEVAKMVEVLMTGWPLFCCWTAGAPPTERAGLLT